MTKFSASLAVLGLLGIAAAVPAAANTINLNTGNGSQTYIINADTLNPSEGGTGIAASVVNPGNLGGGWINNLTSEWISPSTRQDNKGSETDTGFVTYDVSFMLPVGFTSPSLNITLAADDWTTISLNSGSIFYTGPTSGQWTTDTVVPTGSVAGFVAGLNTLEFIVHNTGNGSSDAGGGPTGLDAQVSVNFTPASAGTPEPATTVPLALLGLVGGIALYRRRLASNN